MGVGISSTRGVRQVGAGSRLFLAVCILAQPGVGQAQTDSLSTGSEPPAIRWWHGAIVLGGLSGLMLLDETTQRSIQAHRSASGDDMARALRHFGQPEIFGTVTLGLLGAGLIGDDDGLTRAGGRLALTLALAGATSTAAKVALGRPRPSESLDADGYVPFSGQEAMPSGHTTVAFALATALSDDLHNTWASVGLYSLAGGVGWSRINDNRHWLSDVAAGAVIGITTAKLVNGHWRIFHLHPPRILLGPRQTMIAWQTSF